MSVYKVAYIIGNGPSRKNFDLNKIVTAGDVTFGCNALYRDFEPDWLVAIDDKMIKEIEESNFPKEKFIVSPEQERWESAEYNPMRRRANAGMIAMEKAIDMGYDYLFCLGFDFLRMDEHEVGNIYDGTNAYGPETRAQKPDNYYRLAYLKWFCRKYSNVKFVFVFEDDIDAVRNIKKINNNNVMLMHYNTVNFLLDSKINIIKDEVANV